MGNCKRDGILMIGKKVQVYFNLHKKCYSVRDSKTRLVIAHVNNISLVDVVFKVSEKGRQRVLNEQRKNVHAIVEGIILDYNAFERGMKSVTYNPYKNDSFVFRSDSTAVLEANKCYMTITHGKKARLFAM
jgi:hypothetical protein